MALNVSGHIEAVGKASSREEALDTLRFRLDPTMFEGP
jgi:hypothetical protein